jgi:hypothetical protein
MSQPDDDNTTFTALLVLACIGCVMWLMLLAWWLR